MSRASSSSIAVIDNTLSGKIVDATGRVDGDSIYWDNGADKYKHHASPTISTGTSAPATTPTKIGDLFVDTANAKLYFAKGTSTSADWVAAN